MMLSDVCLSLCLSSSSGPSRE